jgi:hypothetical protein
VEEVRSEEQWYPGATHGKELSLSLSEMRATREFRARSGVPGSAFEKNHSDEEQTGKAREDLETRRPVRNPLQ